MDISAKTDYAIRALLLLADATAQGATPVSVESLARQQQLPRKFLEAILGDLRRAGLVVSQRGSTGGYSLSRDAKDVTLGEVFRAVDGPLAEVRGVRPHEAVYTGAAEHLPIVWVAVRASLRRVLDETSLEHVRSGRLPRHVIALANAPHAWENR